MYMSVEYIIRCLSYPVLFRFHSGFLSWAFVARDMRPFLYLVPAHVVAVVSCGSGCTYGTGQRIQARTAGTGLQAW